MRKTRIFTLLIALTFFVSSFLMFGATNGKKATKAPINPEFIKFRDDFKAGRIASVSKDGHVMGYIPAPLEMSHIQGVVDTGVVQSYPAKYDLRTLNKLTGVRNQGGCGGCWSFGALASTESNLLPNEVTDYSEQHMLLNHGFDWGECVGGNAIMSSAYLLRWSGPVLETDVPYLHSATKAADGYAVQKHLQQVITLPARTDSLDNDTIKYFVTNYGAVTFSYNMVDSLMNFAYFSYYNSDTGTSPNHAVAIVGWDDDFPANHFTPAAPGNGAFIVKNSWGPLWGQNGYFYMSYYNGKIESLYCFTGVEAASNYQRIYQYDAYGRTSAIGYGDTTAWGANIFTAADDGPIKAVGFFTVDKNVKYDIYVYTGVTPGQPTSGTLAAHKSGNRAYAGYYTEVLDSPVNVTAGTNFSVVIKFVDTTYTFPVPLEYPVDGFNSNATANAGESFISHSGSEWEDVVMENPNANVIIKAYAGSGDNPYGDAPFGEMATPVSGSNASSSIPVTGWALDDVGVESVKIYNGDSYIGDAVFIEGARPDVAAAFPSFPNKTKAGWGYMLLSNFLPNGGNGTYTLVAKARDKDGHVTTLGSTTIQIDNLHAVKPFGAIDTPAQGGTASGKSFVVAGWVLTPKPSIIPIDGSTIDVYVDGKKIGNPQYNQYRSDIASLFPDYENSNGAAAGMYLNTTGYSNGLHTIVWNVSDNNGHADGIGSRYFTINNSQSDLNMASVQEVIPQQPKNRSISELSTIPMYSRKNIRYQKGFDEALLPLDPIETVSDASIITIREDDSVRVSFPGVRSCKGYHIIGEELTQLPIGSTIDSSDGTFYWQPSAGFVGDYRLVFVTEDASGKLTQKRITVKINPKFDK